MRILCAGDNVVDRYVDDGVMYPGGNAVNVAVHAARSGADAAYMGVLGDDPAGRHVLACLTEEGVSTELVAVKHGANAHADVRIVNNDRVFIGTDKGVSLFTPTEAQLSAMGHFDVVHTAYTAALRPSIPEISRRALVSFDFGDHTSPLEADDILPHLFLAAFSASHMTEDQALATARRLVDAGSRYVLVTRGGEGAHLVCTRGDWYQPSIPVEVVDSLGAGDSFLAELLRGLVDNESIPQALQIAARTAARVCTQHGAFGHVTPIGSAGARISTPTKAVNQ